MSWAEIKKAVNSDLTTPLNSKIDTQTTTLANKFGLEHVETASIAPNNTFSRSYDAIVVPLQTDSIAVHKGTSNTGTRVFYASNYKNTAFFKLEKNTDYYLNGGNAMFAFYKLGGVFNYLLSLITSTNLEKGGVLV